MSESSELITVVYPLFDIRGSAADRVLTWTRHQTLGREHFRLVAVADGANPAQEQAVAAVLGPRDDLIRVPAGGDVSEMWNEGEARAGTPWVVCIEGHSIARPGCLEAVSRWIAGDPRAAMGNCAVEHGDDTVLARLSHRWFGMILAQWRKPGAWPRLHRAGFVFRAGLIKSLGGFEGEYGQFAPPLLSARLHARGLAMDVIPGAAVLHQDDECIRDHHLDTAGYVRGELDARERSDPIFFERYFGHAQVWANRLRYRPRAAALLLKSLLAAAAVKPWRALAILQLLPRFIGTLPFGLGPRLAIHRAAVAFDEFAVERLPMPAAWRWSRFLRAHARVVHVTQLEWVHHETGAPPAMPATGRWPIEQLGPHRIVGVHAIEEHGGVRFRWAEPAVLLQLPLPESALELRIETAGIRGDPRAFVIAVCAGGRVLPPDLVTSDEHCGIVIRLPLEWLAAARKGLVIVTSPLKEGPPDYRLLGFPITAISCAEAGDAVGTGLAAA